MVLEAVIPQNYDVRWIKNTEFTGLDMDHNSREKIIVNKFSNITRFQPFARVLMNNKYTGLLFLGVDYGTKVVGLATYHWGKDPFPLPYGKIVVKNQAQVIQDICEVIQAEGIEAVVLGLPFYTDGKESEMTKTVRKFGEALQSQMPEIDFFTQDETLKSFEAQERMKNSPRYNFKVEPKQLDALSASIILEDFVKLYKVEE